MKYLVTGATGFLGQHLCRFFDAKKIDYRATARKSSDKYFATGDLTTFTDWSSLFKDIDVVIHSAAKAHDMSGSPELKKIYTDVNLTLTTKLAEQAKIHGVKTFIFISTIKVNGEETGDTPFTADDIPRPTDDYGISKNLAEKEILKLHQPGVFNVVIIRPCLVYGYGVKANFKSLIGFVEKGLPLPFGLVNNRRSLVSVDNLIDLIFTCSTNSKAAGQIFLVSDDKDLSLPELIQTIAQSMHKKILMLPIPLSILKAGLTLIGKKDLAHRLFSNLQVDITKTKRQLNWAPPYTMEQSLQKLHKGSP